MNKAKIIGKWILAGVLFVLLFGFLTMLLWNWLVPSVFNGPHIRFEQALGLLLLTRILFGSWGGGKKWNNGGASAWKHRYYDKLKCMSPEERERFKTRMKDKWCSTSKNESVEKSASSNV
jgi:hypothetical protein